MFLFRFVLILLNWQKYWFPLRRPLICRTFLIVVIYEPKPQRVCLCRVCVCLCDRGESDEAYASVRILMHLFVKFAIIIDTLANCLTSSFQRGKKLSAVQISL